MSNYDLMYGDMFTWLLVIVGVILVIYAQAKVNSAYNKYKKIKCSKNINGAEAARLILKKNNLDLYVVETPGEMSDHYDPSRKTVRLSPVVFRENTIASIAIAAHECGHAIQDKENYTFMRIRASLVPVVNLVSYAGYFAMIISIFMGAMQYLMVGILMELVTVVFQLVTLPVEFDASKRALKEIEELNLVSKEELDGAKKVLSAAAFTYVASALAAILQLLRLLIMYGNRNND